MKTLFLAWQAPTTRAWYPIGRLDADVANATYEFRYTRGALFASRADGFHPISSFPDLRTRYKSAELFPLFQNRVVDSSRRSFSDYLRSLGLGDDADPIQILAVSGGERQTDDFEIFPKLEVDASGRFSSRFFIHGLRHLTLAAQERAFALRDGEELRVACEYGNPVAGKALLVLSNDYLTVGWSPRYLAKDLIEAGDSCDNFRASVIRNNGDAPISRRVLVELSGAVPKGYVPMSSAEFLDIE
ncbi:hypothetical protein [Niveibacterium sp. SC-1]|uniref:hypothetical protein n=1 Tax=Niveibacterium sp. SC-1 TaxID=3135646 RepID=UPI00311DD4BA